MSRWKPPAILYRALRKHASLLQYTDKNFYLNRIKAEFTKNRHLENSEDIEKLMQVINARLSPVHTAVLRRFFSLVVCQTEAASQGHSKSILAPPCGVGDQG